jgi:hypothetical protein
MEGMWKEAVVGYIQVAFRDLSGGTEEGNKNPTHTKELHESKIEPWISGRRIKDLRFRTKVINRQMCVRRLRARQFIELHCSKLKMRRLAEKRLTPGIKLC